MRKYAAPTFQGPNKPCKEYRYLVKELPKGVLIEMDCVPVSKMPNFQVLDWKEVPPPN